MLDLFPLKEIGSLAPLSYTYGVPPESDDNLHLEIGHVLFIDIVGYSKLLIEEQKERLNQLTEIVLATAQVRASTDEQLVRLPTGDGMALVFRRSAEEPARCALEIAEALLQCREAIRPYACRRKSPSERTIAPGAAQS
jgi:hypothetical protein